MSGPSLLIVIPGYNVAKTIADVLRRLSPSTLAAISEIVVVDNCSTDTTLEVVRELQAGHDALAARLTVIRNQANYGLGGSLKIGLTYALDRSVDYVGVIHSDKQGDSEVIARSFIEAIRDGQPDFVMANRFLRGAQLAGYSRPRVIGNHVFNVLTLLLTGQWISDSGCGIIAARTSLLRRLKYQALQENFLFNPQLNILIHAAGGVRIQHVPLTWTDPEVPSNLRVVRYLAALTRSLLSYRLNRWNLDRLDRAALDSEVRTRLTHQVWPAPVTGDVPPR